jgi:hypothetical protein
MKRYPTLREIDVRNAGRAVLELKIQGKFKTIDKRYEKTMQFILFGYLQCRRGKMEMEFNVKNLRKKGTKRIDLRYAAANPGFIELATVAEHGYNVEHQPRSNRTELEKLSLKKFDLRKNRTGRPGKRLSGLLEKTWE